jgi:hypothetical protein
MSATHLPALIASLFNLGGPDLIIILLMLVLMAAPVVGIVLLVIYLNRRKPAQPPPSLPMAASVAERLKHLEQLKQQSLISDTEYEEQRSRIITGV